MSWIKEADLPDLPEIFRAISSNGQALELVEQLNEGIAFGSSALTRAQEEAIATAVSVANRCRYGALTHGGFLRKHAGGPDIASQMLADYTQADLSQPDRVILDFSVKLTIEPAELTEEDLERLRVAGFTDDQIVSIVLVTCLFNFMNRIASSLGVEVPAPFVRSVERWLTGPAAEKSWLLGPDAGQNPGNLNWSGLGKALGELSRASPPQVASCETQNGPKGPVLPQTVINPPEGALNVTANVEKAAIIEGPSADFTPGGGPLGNNALTEEPLLAVASSHERVADPASTEAFPVGASSSEQPPADIASVEGLPQDALKAKDSPEDSEQPAADAAPKVDSQLSQFVSECCKVGEGEACTARNLYVAYQRWCDLNLNAPMLQRNFGLGLSEMGFQRRRRKHGQHWWLGLSVNSGDTGR